MKKYYPLNVATILFILAIYAINDLLMWALFAAGVALCALFFWFLSCPSKKELQGKIRQTLGFSKDKAEFQCEMKKFWKIDPENMLVIWNDDQRKVIVFEHPWKHLNGEKIVAEINF